MVDRRSEDMAETNEEQAPFPRVAEFYNGKSVLMTGAAGYLGVIILETLLELCPGINYIYILLRERKGVCPAKRKDAILQRSVFDKLRENMPEVLEKVQCVSGDVSLPNFGMSEEDLQKVKENVNIVFHIAASINFTKTLKYTLQHNVMSTQYAIDICRQLKKLDALVFTSSTFGNVNRKSPIKEEVYRLPFHAQKFVDEISNGTDESLDQLVSECFPHWPNSYTFSKSLAENVLQDNASDLPVIIVRPSIIGSVWKRPLPGYIEANSGITALTIGVGKGFLKAVPGDPDNIFDFVPGDICASTHIVAAWSVATNRSPPMHVINNSSCVRGTMQRYTDVMLSILEKIGGVYPNSFRSTNKFRFIKNPIEYKLVSLFHHYVPGYCFDALLKIKGSKLRLVPIYKMADRAIEALMFFMKNHWEFNTENFHNLLKQLQDEDLKMFELEQTTSNGDEIAEVLPIGAPFLRWSTDKKSREQRKKAATQRLYLTYLFQGLFLLLVAVLFYFLLLILLGLSH